MSKSDTGFVYIATGLKFVKEAEESVGYLRKCQTEPVCLITDKIYEEVTPFWDDVILLTDPKFGLKDKTNLFLAPYEKCLFLDTDTYVTENISELFQLLQEFDLVAHQLFEGHEYEMEGVPHAFPEFNTGVIGYRNTPALKEFCHQWMELYDFYLKDTVNDQRSFRRAVYYGKLRHTVISPEYNYRPLATNFAIQKLKIIHGRTFPLLQKLEKKMNKNVVHRAHVPSLDIVVSDYMDMSDFWTMWKRSSAALLRQVARKVTPSGLKNALRSNKTIRLIFSRNRYHDWMENE